LQFASDDPEPPHVMQAQSWYAWVLKVNHRYLHKNIPDESGQEVRNNNMLVVLKQLYMFLFL